MITFFALINNEQSIIYSLVIIFATSSVAALVFQRLKLALIPAFLVGGIVVGPDGMNLAQTSHALSEIGHLAVVLLLFGVGMDLHVSALKKEATVLLGSSIGACLLCVAIGIPVIMAFGLSLPRAMVLAMGFSLSSTALVLRLLATSRELVRGHGQLSLAILVTQDLLVLFMLAAIPLVAEWSNPLVRDLSQQQGAYSTAFTGIATALGLAAIFVSGQKILPRLMAESLRNRSSEVLMLSAVAVAFLTAYATYLMGFSLEMGAFLSGFLLASSPFRYQLAGQIAPLRDLFMAVFFTSLGMELDLDVVFANLPTVFLGTILLLICKTLCILLAALAFGVHARIALLAAIILAQAGEFSLIVFDKALGLNILSADQLSLAVAIVIISLIVTPALFSISKKIAEYAHLIPSAPWIKKISLNVSEEIILSATGEHVIVAGLGPVGQGVCRFLIDVGIPFTVVELNPDTVRQEKEKGINIFYGDISNEAVLKAVRIEQASSLMLTFPDAKLSIEAAKIARMLNPEIEIVARASSIREKIRLQETDIDDAVVDEELSSQAMVQIACRIADKYPDQSNSI